MIKNYSNNSDYVFMCQLKFEWYEITSYCKYIKVN